MSDHRYDPDDPYGLRLSGGDDPGLRFLKPYRHIGELSEPELMKLRRHPFEVAQAVLDRYSKLGPAALAAEPGDVERLKWVGMYPQKQGGDAFMMRVKVPGGVLTAAQAREIGVAAEAYGEGPLDHALFGNRYVDITTRQTVQLHWLRLADIPRIWQRFAAVGLTSVQACGDCARNVTSCPVSGVDRHELVDSLSVAKAVSDFFTGNRGYANLPRKFKISISGCAEDCSRVEINDIGLWPARRGDLVGFNVLAGGGLSDGERMASDLDVFIEADQAVELCRGIAQVFGELGNREHRGMARMRYLVQELGPEGFRAELARRVDLDLATAGEELTTGFRRDHVGVHPQRQDGVSYVGCVVPVGRMNGAELIEAARLADTYGDGTVRFGVDQNFILSGISNDRVPALLEEPLLQRYSPNAGPFTRGVVACTGNEFCRYAITETKERGVRLAQALDARLAEAGASERLTRTPLRIHLSGCSASCAQPQIADIGLRGAVAKRPSAFEEGYDLGLGGALGPEAGFIDWVEGAVPARKLGDVIFEAAMAYDAEAREDESFASWARRTPISEHRARIAGGSQ